jgi:hypothetical protein
MPSAGTLKGLVIALGVAIALALAMVVYGLARLVPDVVSTDRALSDGAAPHVTSLGQPNGTRLMGMTQNGSRWLLQVTGGGLPDRVLVVESGLIRETIFLSDPAASEISNGSP